MSMVAMVAIDFSDIAELRSTLAPSQHHSPVGQERDRTIHSGHFALPIEGLLGPKKVKVQ